MHELLATPNLTYNSHTVSKNDDELLGYELPLRSFDCLVLCEKTDEPYKPLDRL